MEGVEEIVTSFSTSKRKTDITVTGDVNTNLSRNYANLGNADGRGNVLIGDYQSFDISVNSPVYRRVALVSLCTAFGVSTWHTLKRAQCHKFLGTFDMTPCTYDENGRFPTNDFCCASSGFMIWDCANLPNTQRKSDHMAMDIHVR